MTRLVAGGDRAAAIRTYRALVQRLRRELGVAVSGPTRELFERLRVEPAATPRVSRPTAIAGQLPLIGRDRERAELETVLGRVAGGSGAVAVIRGQAGIGKTRLAGELLARARSAGCHTATCAALDLGGAAPLSLWAELIRGLLPELAAPAADVAWPEDVAVLASELPEHFAREGRPRVAVAPDLQRTRLYEAVVAMLAWAARERPVLLVLEDAHSADGPSLELAGYAMRRLAGLRVMLLITRRALPQRPDADLLEHALRSRGLLACELELGALPEKGAAELARSAARLSDTDVRHVVQRAEGNALLVVETARAMGRGETEIAPSLRGMVRATLATVTGEGRRLVEIAAVAARPLAPAELGRLSLTDPDEAVEGALQAGLLLADDDGVGFRHALVRDAVYEEIAEPRRRGLHQRWAEALLASEDGGAPARPAEVARQLRLAGADAEAVPQLARAAADARSVAALAQAVAYLEEALAIAPDRADLWLELGEIEAWRARRDQAEAAFKQALARIGTDDPVGLARAWLRRARAYHGPICVPRAVLESAANALELIERGEQPAPAEFGEAIAARAWAEAVAGSVEEAERLLVQLSAGAAGGDDLRTYDVGHARALALMRRGRFVESYGPSIAAGDAAGRAGRPDLAYGCWANAAGAAAAAGEYERALEFLDRGMDAIAGHGLQSLEIHLLAERAFILSRLDRLADARGVAEAERSLAEQLAQPGLLAMADHDRGLIELQAGEFQLAAELLARSLVDEARLSRPLTRLALAEALAGTRDVTEAAEQIRATVLEPVRASDFPQALVPRLARVQGLIAAARDDGDEADRRLEESIAGWERVLDQMSRAETMTTVLADLGRPVVGLVEPERELARARADREAIKAASAKERSSAVVP